MLRNLSEFRPKDIEERVLAFWKTNNIFAKTILARKRRKKFVFFEGPPTANGRPGIHHVLARAFKDVVLRYKTMAGFSVPRRGGWDTHGLPVEIEVEKKLGFKSKKDIERFGVAEFNRKCKESVWEYLDEWKKMTERMGFWLDLKNAYVTYENAYIETLWWIFARARERGLLFKGHKIVPWCTRCGTALSSHELAQGYKEVEDTSVYVKFKLKTQNPESKTSGDTFILSWTTTPWTLLGNVALAVNPDADYVKAEASAKNEVYILAKERLSALGEPLKVVETMKGSQLVGLAYQPLFSVPFFSDAETQKTAFRVYPAEFVTMDDGTGVVHTAVMYGEDDYDLGKKFGLPALHTVTPEGVFAHGVPEVEGMKAKDPETEQKIINALNDKGLLLKTASYLHEYPFCWRCGTPLLYYARESWFLGMRALRKELAARNKTINWIPAHIKEGRFGQWISDVKDWAISRERFWGTPLPIWECAGCGHTEVIESRAALSGKLPRSANRYILLRHGEAVNNTREIVSGPPEREDNPLTLHGRVQAEKAGRRLARARIDAVFASDLQRTKETAEIVARAIGAHKVVYDKRLREIETGMFNYGPVSHYRDFFSSIAERFVRRPEGGETLRDVARRAFSFVNEMEEKHRGKTILVVSHEYVLWMLSAIMHGMSETEAAAEKEKRGDDFLTFCGAERVEFVSLPRDENGLADLHKPYVDAVVFPCEKCKGEMRRVSEVADVWFDSGAMPFAQAHFPFSKKIDFPADYIVEAIDQTRGWFYTLLAVATLLKRGAPFKSAISLGFVLDKYGQKMSKSKGNVVNPWEIIEKYGVDAARFYFYSVNAPGDEKNFDEEELAQASRKSLLLAYNSFVFLNTYARTVRIHPRRAPASSHVLDQWILTRLSAAQGATTKMMDAYDIMGAAREIAALVDDLSRWYIRRSRRRIQKPLSPREYQEAAETLGFTLVSLAKLMAPFVPFFAEALYLSLKGKSSEENAFKESVHLEDWPRAPRAARRSEERILKEMEETRNLASLALAKREEAGVKVRQPLLGLVLKSKIAEQFVEVLKEEINVREVSFDASLQEPLKLDTALTEDLVREGIIREMVRMVQGMRQKIACKPSDKVEIFIASSTKIESAIRDNEKLFLSETSASRVEFRKEEKADAQAESVVSGEKIILGVKKA